MSEGKECPKCGELCFQEAFVPNIVFGYRCKNCGNEFNVWKIVVGWNDEVRYR